MIMLVKTYRWGQVVVVHNFKPNIHETEAGGSLPIQG